MDGAWARAATLARTASASRAVNGLRVRAKNRANDARRRVSAARLRVGRLWRIRKRTTVTKLRRQAERAARKVAPDMLRRRFHNDPFVVFTSGATARRRSKGLNHEAGTPEYNSLQHTRPTHTCGETWVHKRQSPPRTQRT